jgi:hypothetical protein
MMVVVKVVKAKTLAVKIVPAVIGTPVRIAAIKVARAACQEQSHGRTTSH